MKKLFNLLQFFAIFSLNSIILSGNSSVHTVFAPGVSSSIKRVEAYAKGGAFLNSDYTNIVFPDQKKPKKLVDRIIYRVAKNKGRTVNRSKIVLAASHDIKAVKKSVDLAQAKKPQADGILYGTCRGASAIIQYLANHDTDWVKGVVLDSPFADPNVVLADRVSPKLANLFLPSFDKKAQSPIKAIKSIKNKKIKILILYAKGNASKGGLAEWDQITPFTKHIKPIYDELKKHGFDVTLVGYEADHCGGIDPEERKGDNKAYVQKVHDWYQKNGFKA